jgi:hypothetical protein
MPIFSGERCLRETVFKPSIHSPIYFHVEMTSAVLAKLIPQRMFFKDTNIAQTPLTSSPLFLLKVFQVDT